MSQRSWLRPWLAWLLPPYFLLVAACIPSFESENPLPVMLDPGVLSGQLDNGFRYYLRSANSALDNDRIELRLVVKAGSLNEAAGQRGYSHLLEHMAYRGTQSFSAERIETLLSDNGLRWGDDVNATTQYAATVYRFSFDQSDEHLLPDVLALMAEWLDAMEFEPSALEREKRVVDAELRERYVARSYVIDPVTASAYAGTRYDNRQPAGDIRTIHQATVDDLRHYWRAHYRPDNAVLIIAGGDKPWQLEPLIFTAFGGLDARVNAPLSEPVKNTVGALTERAVGYFKDGMLVELLPFSDPTLDLPTLSVNFISRDLERPSDAADSVELIKTRFRSQLLHSAFSHLVRGHIKNTLECSAVNLEASLLESGQVVEHITLTLTDEAMMPCLAVAFSAVNSVSNIKLTSEEFTEFKSQFGKIEQLILDQYRSRDAKALASDLVEMITNGETVLSAWDMQQSLAEVMAEFDLNALNAMFSNIAKTHKVVFSAVSNTSQLPTLADMIVAVEEKPDKRAGRARSIVVHGDLRADQTRLASTDLYQSVPSESSEMNLSRSVVEQPLFSKVHSDEAYHEWRLANGATVILLQDAEYDQFAVTAISDGGYAGTANDFALTASSLPAFLSVNGVDGYTSQSLRSIMRQRGVFVEPFVEPRHRGLHAGGAPHELAAVVSLMGSYFSEPLILEPQSSLFHDQLINSKSKLFKIDPTADSQLLYEHKVVSGNARFIETHRKLFGTTEDFGFIFVGMLAPEDLELELHRLLIDNEAPNHKSSVLAQRAVRNTIALSHNEEYTGITVMLACPDAYQQAFMGADVIGGNQSLRYWQLLVDIVNEKLRYALREEHGLIYELNSSVLAASRLVSQFEFSVRPGEEALAHSIVSDVLSKISIGGVSEQDFASAVARDNRNRKSTGYESFAKMNAQQWLYSKDIISDNEVALELTMLNKMAQCVQRELHQVPVESLHNRSIDRASANFSDVEIVPHPDRDVNSPGARE